MKSQIFICSILSFLFCSAATRAQDSTTVQTKKKHSSVIQFGSRGLQIKPYDSTAASSKAYKEQKHKKFESHWIMFDLGTNFLHSSDNTAGHTFDLRQAKSINVDLYVWMGTWNVLNTKSQKINISTGVGFQFYNFRFENPVTYTRNPNGIIMDTISFKKDKLAFDYLTVPLMVTFKSHLYSKHYLVYGVGITGGYRLASWTKQVSDERGKVKVHGQFDFANFNSCLTAEIGISETIRFYGSYQLTSLMNDNELDQRPICVGIRFSGI